MKSDDKVFEKLWSKWAETRNEEDWFILCRYMSIQEGDLRENPPMLRSKGSEKMYFWYGWIAAMIFLWIFIEVKRKNG